MEELYRWNALMCSTVYGKVEDFLNYIVGYAELTRIMKSI